MQKVAPQINKANRCIGWMSAALIACTVNVARGEPVWSWSFSPETVALPYEGYIFGQFSNDASSTEDLLFGGVPVSELPGDGHFFLPELGTRIVFSSVPSSTVVLPGQSVALPVFSIVLENPAATPIANGTYAIQPAYQGLLGLGNAWTSRVADQPLILTVSAVPELSTLASLLVGLPLLLVSICVAKGSVEPSGRHSGGTTALPLIDLKRAASSWRKRLRSTASS